MSRPQYRQRAFSAWSLVDFRRDALPIEIPFIKAALMQDFAVLGHARDWFHLAAVPDVGHAFDLVLALATATDPRVEPTAGPKEVGRRAASTRTGAVGAGCRQIRWDRTRHVNAAVLAHCFSPVICRSSVCAA